MDNKKVLKDKIKEISDMGWIETNNKSLGNIGLKIESLLGVQNNNLEYPDFEGIEIKTKMDCDNKFLTLFNATPDNNFFEIKRIHEKYGYPDKNDKNYMVFNVSVFSKRPIELLNYKFQLYIDETSNKIRMLVFNRNGELIESRISWSFSMLKEKFERKFNQLCIIKVHTKTFNNIIYFRVKSFQIYRCKEFNNFIDLISNDKIRITFKIGVFKSGRRVGEIHDRGTGFDLNIKYIEEMFDKCV